MKYIGYVTTFILFGVVSSLINGYAFALIWSWFMSPLFSLPLLSLPYAIGLGLTVNFLTASWPDKSDDKDFMETMTEHFVKVLSKVFIFIAIGWVVVQFV
jgi:hypothetical protein